MRARAVFIGAVALLFMSVAVSTFNLVIDTDSLGMLTNEEMRQFTAFDTHPYSIPIIWLLIAQYSMPVFGLSCFILFLYITTPSFRVAVLKDWRNIVRVSLSFIAGACLVLYSAFENYIHILAQINKIEVSEYLVALAWGMLAALAWTLIGSIRTEASGPLNTRGKGVNAILGFLAGLTLYSLVAVCSSAMMAFVSYVDANSMTWLDKLTAWEYPAYTIFVSLLCGISAAFVSIGLRPASETHKARLRSLALAVLLAAVAFGIVFATNHKTDELTDMYRKPLPMIAGLDNTLDRSWRAMPLYGNSPADGTIWPTTLSSEAIYPLRRPNKHHVSVMFSANETNIKGLESFRRENKLPTKLREQVDNLIMVGYFKIMDIDSGARRFASMVDSDFLFRMQFFRFKCWRPVTDVNRQIYSGFIFEKDWYLHKKSTEVLTEAIFCMGLEGDERAKPIMQMLSDREISEIKKDVSPGKGTIRGRIDMTQLALEDATLVLSLIDVPRRIDDMTYRRPELSNAILLPYMVAAQRLGPYGRFNFERLQDLDHYHLFLVDKSGKLPIGQGVNEVENMPGIITINSTTPNIDLGTIRISAKSQ